MPSDHAIADPAPSRALARGGAGARAGALVTFAIVADRPETGYGYIRRGAACPPDGCYASPPSSRSPTGCAPKATSRLDYFWNSGIFLFPAGSISTTVPPASEDDRRLPRPREGAARSRLLALDAPEFAGSPANRSTMPVSIPAAPPWFRSAWLERYRLVGRLWSIGSRDGDGKVIIGDVIARMPGTPICAPRST